MVKKIPQSTTILPGLSKSKEVLKYMYLIRPADDFVAQGRVIWVLESNKINTADLLYQSDAQRITF